MPTKRPAKQATSITIRLTEQLVDKLREMAHKERRSLSNYVRFVLETHAGFVREERTPEEIGRPRHATKQPVRKPRRASRKRAAVHKLIVLSPKAGVAPPGRRKSQKR
jgi:hypothetical protein